MIVYINGKSDIKSFKQIFDIIKILERNKINVTKFVLSGNKKNENTIEKFSYKTGPEKYSIYKKKITLIRHFDSFDKAVDPAGAEALRDNEIMKYADVCIKLVDKNNKENYDILKEIVLSKNKKLIDFYV